MSSLNFFSRVVNKTGDFKKYVLENITKLLDRDFFTKLKQTEDQIRQIVIQSITNQPEYSSLKSGILRNHFGLANTTLVDSILNQLENVDIQVTKPRISGNSIQASFVLNMIKENFTDILSSTDASYVTEKGSTIDWLRWLLLEGNNSVIIGYKYIPKVDSRSRTGRGIMVSGESAVYRVPPEFSGTESDNWITRGIDEAMPQIESYLNKMV